MSACRGFESFLGHEVGQQVQGFLFVATVAREQSASVAARRLQTP
jgi:hypothetical protein